MARNMYTIHSVTHSNTEAVIIHNNNNVHTHIHARVHTHTRTHARTHARTHTILQVHYSLKTKWMREVGSGIRGLSEK